jgi:hypothetical protein
MILMKFCIRYVISAELNEGTDWIPSVCCQSKEHSVLLTEIASFLLILPRSGSAFTATCNKLILFLADLNI